MDIFGIKRVAGYSIRKLLTKAVTVEWAARIHRVPLDEFMRMRYFCSLRCRHDYSWRTAMPSLNTCVKGKT